MKDHIFRLLVFILLAAAGFVLVPIVIHFTIWANILDGETVPQNFLKNVIQKSSFVWMGAVVIGIISLFIPQRWRIILLLCPLVLPSLFVMAYIVTQS